MNEWHAKYSSTQHVISYHHIVVFYVFNKLNREIFLTRWDLTA